MKQDDNLTLQTQWRSQLIMVLLLGFSLLIAYTWLIRAADDLSWDETHNYRIYGRHPLVAISLYLEPNNHPLDSLFKSFFYGLLTLNEPAFYHFSGFILMMLFLMIVWHWITLLKQADAVHGAAVLVVLLLSSNGIQQQVMNLRGYFPSMVLALCYLLLLMKKRRRWLGLADPVHENPDVTASIERRNQRVFFTANNKDLFSFAVLSALLIFTVPTNIICAAALWTITAIKPSNNPPLKGAGRGHIPAAAIKFARTWLKLALLSIVVSLILYGPILLGFLLGINRFDNAAGGFSFDLLRGLIKDPYLLLSLTTPVGLPPVVFSIIAVSLVGLAIAYSQRAAIAYIGAILFLSSLLFSGMFSTIMRSIPRIKTPLVPLLCIAMTFIFAGLTGHWSKKQKQTAAICILAAGLLLLPNIVRTTDFHREASRVAAFLETYCRPSERLTLVCHTDHALSFPLWRVFSQSYVIDGAGGLDRTFSGVPKLRVSLDTSFKKTLLNIFFPDYHYHAIKQEEIEVLVLISSEHGEIQPDSWKHPALQQIKQRLTHRSEYDIGQYHLTILQLDNTAFQR